jgi:hypothetical protein
MTFSFRIIRKSFSLFLFGCASCIAIVTTLYRAVGKSEVKRSNISIMHNNASLSCFSFFAGWCE